jgi:gliding motility-associated-like protein
MPVKVVDNQLWIDNSNVKYYFNNSTSYVKTLAFSIGFFTIGFGNFWGQTFTTIGTSNGLFLFNSGIEYPCPLADYKENHRAQYLIRASELTASGIPAGAIISKIGFNVIETYTGVIERLSIYLGGTKKTSLGNTFLTEPCQRYGPTDYIPVLGNNTFNFSSNYTWNGTDNILIQICNGSSLATEANTWSLNASVSYETGLSFNASYTTAEDENNTLCAKTFEQGTQTTRPLITFEWTTVPPVANFTANQTNISTATTVSFTDESSGYPTSWDWSISPATGWNFSGGTTASSQNPQLKFDNAGKYSVTLIATNSKGSDAETKANYIFVLKIPIAISPNGDDYNDTWDILGIDEIEDFKLEIFDLSGNTVYAQFESENNGVYTPFAGKNNNDIDIIDGDYIYSIKSKNKDLKYSGILTIKRK